MIDIMAADAPFAQDFWALAVASTALDDAHEALVGAAVALEALLDATRWQVTAGESLAGRLTGLLSSARASGAAVARHRQLLDRMQPW